MPPIENVHLQLGLDGTDGAYQQFLMKGTFLYYHFMQDPGLNDRGWACAYRSVQMLLSWYRITVEKKSIQDVDVPSVVGIQQRLVEMDDKPPSFFKSTDWIGCYEAFLCLDSFCNASARISYSRSAVEALDKQNLAAIIKHFQTHASPVMIGGNGGGARVLLGVRIPSDVNADELSPEQLQLLLIDPHYTGADNIETIRAQKQWCMWQNAKNFFSSHTFYNMCYPLTPNS